MSSTSHSLAPKSPRFEGESELVGCSVVATVARPSSGRFWSVYRPSSLRAAAALGMREAPRCGPSNASALEWADTRSVGRYSGPLDRKRATQHDQLRDVSVHGVAGADEGRHEGPQQEDHETARRPEGLDAAELGRVAGEEDAGDRAAGRV